MDFEDVVSQKIKAAFGEKKSQLVLKNANVVNVFTCEIEHTDIAIENGTIVGLGSYAGETEVDLGGNIVCPGLIDGHIHIESSMVSPYAFGKAVLPHGTTSVITDPHEIANVAGTNGIEYMMEATKNLDIEVFFVLPSCVPATPLDESGAELSAEMLERFYSNKRVVGLAEMMNAYGTVRADKSILDKINGAVSRGKIVDGHAPNIEGKELNAYITAGVVSDHECTNAKEAMKKLKRGQWIMIREGTAAKNLNELMPLFERPFCERCLLVTDDKHPGDLIQKGHIDYIIREAVKNGADPINAIKMATLNAATYFGIKNQGAVAPGYQADLIVVSDLENFEVQKVYKKGRLVAENGKYLENEKAPELKLPEEVCKSVFDSFNLSEITEKDLILDIKGESQRVICMMPKQILTTEKIVPFKYVFGAAPGVDLKNDIIKLAVFERHHNTGHVGIGFLGGYGLKKGAVASSIAHDSHNLLIAGTNDADMILSGNRVRENKGGLAIAVDGKIVGELPLPIGGIMTNQSVYEVEETLERMKETLRKLGIPEDIDPFMTLSFMSLPVIPSLRLNTYGVVDVDNQKIVDAVF